MIALTPTIYALATGLIFIIALVFSMLGLGGGMLYVPVLVWLGLPLKAVAIPLGLLLNGITTLSAFARFAHAGLVDFRGGLPAALSALLLAPLGARLVAYVPRQQLLLLFALLVIVAALRTLLPSRQTEPRQTPQQTPQRRALIGAAVGGLAGFIAGLLGVGGGFIVAPMLMALGYPIKQAAATTAFIVTFSSFSGFLGHLTAAPIDPLLAGLAGLTVMAVIIGSQLGAWLMMNKAKPSWVKRLYGVLLLAVAAKLLYGLWASIRAQRQHANENPDIPASSQADNPMRHPLHSPAFFAVPSSNCLGTPSIPQWHGVRPLPALATKHRSHLVEKIGT